MGKNDLAQKAMLEMFQENINNFCADCASSLQKGRVPQYCRLDGFDWGVKPDHLPELSRLELVAISRVVLYCTTAKIQGRRSSDPIRLI